jgi:type IV secretory pathway VirB2 component (pilin)
MALPDGVLAAVKNYLDITWTDDAGDTKLSGIVARGMAYIDGVAGSAMDYTTEGKPLELLLDYVRYARSNALDEFQGNYLHELLGLQMAQMIAEGISCASLSALTIGSLILTPAFAAATYEYTAATTNASDVITATAAKITADILITVNGISVENGEVATWETGSNIVKVVVTFGAAEMTYLFVVTR